MILSAFAVVGLVGILGLAVVLLAAALWRGPVEQVQTPPAWKRYRFGFATNALIFLAFDMEMIFMYPWAVVFAGIGLRAFGDMLVFICLLAAGLSYAWALGGLKWE